MHRIKAKLTAIVRIIRCTDFLLMAKKENGYLDINYTCDNKTAIRRCAFLHNFLEEGDAAVNEAQKIIDTYY